MKNIIFKTPLTESLDLETIESLVRRMLDESQMVNLSRTDLVLDIAKSLKAQQDWNDSLNLASELVITLEELVGALWHLTQLLNLPMQSIRIIRHGRSLVVQVQ